MGTGSLSVPSHPITAQRFPTCFGMLAPGRVDEVDVDDGQRTEIAGLNVDGPLAGVRVDRQPHQPGVCLLLVGTLCDAVFAIPRGDVERDDSRAGRRGCCQPRFNMPFEFGMAYQRTEETGGAGAQHDWLALVPHDHPHAEFISDIAAYDLKTHSGTAETVIPPLMGWLATRQTTSNLPSGLVPASLIKLLPEMRAVVATLNLNWAGQPPWTHLVGVVRDLLAAKLP
jgi:hypothetical protein